MFNFNSKSEKIYKFVYKEYGDNRTMLLTACNPTQAVKKFNRMSGYKLYNIVEFTEVIPKNNETI